MKLASLLADFLYTHKRLDLPGIGSFLLDSTATVSSTGEGIHFENNTGIKEAPDLVNFIATTSGKIKALAAADLDSHLETARQFLNIGKPFLFEGIGTLVKQQAGGFHFTPGIMLPEKVKEHEGREMSEGVEREEPVTGFKSIFYGKKATTNPKKTLGILLMLAGLAFAIWGGYTIYKKTISRKNNKAVEKTEIANTTVKDTVVQTKDTLPVTTSAIPAAGSYKFIVETADKPRALKRYSLLKGYGLDIKMETNDSLSFKLFFMLAVSPADTSRYLDSLQRLYTPPWNKAYIEK